MGKQRTVLKRFWDTSWFFFQLSVFSHVTSGHIGSMAQKKILCRKIGHFPEGENALFLVTGVLSVRLVIMQGWKVILPYPGLFSFCLDCFLIYFRLLFLIELDLLVLSPYCAVFFFVFGIPRISIFSL